MGQAQFKSINTIVLQNELLTLNGLTAAIVGINNSTCRAGAN